MRGRVAAAAMAMAACAAAGWADGGIERLERLGDALRQRPVWTSEFQQEYVPAGMDLGDETAGAVWVAWPDRALFDTGTPALRRLALDGREVRLLDLEVGSCDDHTLTDDEWARVPLTAVLDPRRAIDRFTLLAGGDAEVVMVPREPGGISRVTIRAGADGLPAEIVIEDPQGAVNRLRFTGWRPADGPPGGAWLPPPPVGIECVRDAAGAGPAG